MGEDLSKQLIACLKAELAPLDFKWRGHCFVRELQGVSHLIAIQKSTSSLQSRVTYTINFGLWSEVISRSQARGYAKPTSIQASHSNIPRIGMFLKPKPEDIWWTIESSEDIERSVGEAMSIIVRDVLPILAPIDSTETLYRHWLSGPAQFDGDSAHKPWYLEYLQAECDRRQ